MENCKLNDPKRINDILAILPHRYPFVMVDRVQLLHRHKSLRAWKRISINEPFFCGHFPEEKVFPGVLITEACAQAAALLVGFSAQADHADDLPCFTPKHAYLTRINVKILGKAIPGDTLEMDVRLDRQDGQLFSFTVAVQVDRREIASGTLLMVIIPEAISTN